MNRYIKLQILGVFGDQLQEDDMAISKRLMIFVDGENLTIQYQRMLQKGHIPQDNVIHKPDIFVWSNRMPLPLPIIGRTTNIEIIRAYYYTSITGSNNMSDVEEEIRRINLPNPSVLGETQSLYPVIFKKLKGKKSKGVDIRLTIDILSDCYNNNLDTVCLFAGDGDYEPLLREVMEQGKNINLFFFSEGFNPILKSVCDKYTCLDSTFFKS